MNAAAKYRTAIEAMPAGIREGVVAAYNGLVIEADGPDAQLAEHCELHVSATGEDLLSQVVGFRDGRVLLMPYGTPKGLRVGDRIHAKGEPLRIPVGEHLLGRVIDAFGAPMDGRGPIAAAGAYEVQRPPIAPLTRADITAALDTGIRVIDTLLTMGKGQRVGIFAGSGVGKSTLLGMIARNVKADVVVLGLIGERGREVGDFVDGVLGEAGLRNAVVVAATSDQPALVRTHATHVAHAIAEYFRDKGKDVLLIVDSITRFAMAQREIGLAAGEPPTMRGYPPSVFNILPQLVERGGNLRDKGSVSCIYSVLVEGDDMNEPVADHMRALLDGHVVLSRDIAHRGQLPAIDILQSVSRLMPRLSSDTEREIAGAVQRMFASYEASRDLIDMGAYQKGSNPELDRAIEFVPRLQSFFAQTPGESHARSASIAGLSALLDRGGATS